MCGRGGRAPARGGGRSSSHETGRNGGRGRATGRGRELDGGYVEGRVGGRTAGRGRSAQSSQSTNDTTNRPSSSPPPWSNKCEAKILLRELLNDSTSIAHTKTVPELHQLEPLFRQYPLNNFQTNYRNLKKTIVQAKECAAFDQGAYEKEKANYPRNPLTVRGHPFWDGSAAQTLLAVDVREGRTDGLSPIEAYQLRPLQYGIFPLHVFRNHLYKERSKQLQDVYWQQKRNKKGAAAYLRQQQRSNEEQG